MCIGLPFLGWTQTLTQLIVDGCVDDLISRNVAIGFRRFCPAELSDSWTDDIKGQAPRFTRHWRKQNSPHVVSSNLALLSQNSPLIIELKLFAPQKNGSVDIILLTEKLTA